MADEKQSLESRGTSRRGSGIFPDADYLFSRARILFRAARATLGAEREQLESAAHELELQAQNTERSDRYGYARGGDKPGTAGRSLGSSQRNGEIC